MASEISVAEVDQAEAALLEAKKSRKKNIDAFKAQKEETARIRQEWRLQEERAGRRTPGVTADNTGG